MENRGYRARTDAELTEICVIDREAFGELARRYRPIAFRAAFSILRNERDAEDQVQSAFCKALEHIGNFEGRAKFSTWLVRIVMNGCLMQLRRARRVGLIPLDDAASALLLRVADSKTSPESVTEAFYVAKVLRREIRRIPPLLRKTFLLRDVEQRSMPEVAAVLEISVEAAKSRLARAREELRKRLTPHLMEHFAEKPLQAGSCNFQTITKETFV
jgi:RNA polymerase sigma-70 factor (ECF subfamily)